MSSSLLKILLTGDIVQWSIRPRILVADDHPLVLEGLRKLLQEEGCEVVGVAEDGYALIDKAQQLRPDVVVSDISMPLLNGLEAARRLTKLLPGVKIIFLTMHADATYANQAIQAGAVGYLLKRSAVSELTQAIRLALVGQKYLTPSLYPEAEGIPIDLIQRARLPVEKLTDRQREVLQLIAEGKRTKEIAGLLNLSVKTVEFHKMKIKEQLGLKTTADLTKYAIAHGLASGQKFSKRHLHALQEDS